MKAKLLAVLTFACAGLASAQTPALAAPAAKPTMVAVCGTCHKPSAGMLRGYVENVALKSSSLQLDLGSGMEIVRFDPKALKVLDSGIAKPAEHLGKVRKGHEARVEFSEKDGVKTASVVSLKGPITIAPEKLVSYDEVAKLVSAGPDKARYTLVDSRPLPRFQEGTIPTAINLPYPAFDKMLDRLPPEKDRLLVFFCQGVTCMMSPNSLRRAEALGYTNAKVYREGWPEWTKHDYGVTKPEFVKEAFMDKGIPMVLVDVRPAGEAKRAGFIPGAVAIPADALGAAIEDFPDKELKAPIMVYDATGGEEAVQAARRIVKAGYENVVVVTGGLGAWRAKGYPLASGEPALKVAYAPRPRAGSLPIEEFKRLVLEHPADTVILDVRNRDEAKYGMIAGAVLVPDEEVLERLSEIPRDKRIVTHCSTGVRAEMAYHKLKERGYKAAFLNADVDVGKDGRFEVTPK